MRVFALACSPRRGGNSESLLDVVLADLHAAGHAVTKVSLADYRVEGCQGHGGRCSGEACPIDDGFAEMAEEAMAADCFVLAIPVYYWGVPAQLKAYIDRHVHYYGRRRYAARAIGVIIVAADDGISETEEQVHSFLIKGGHVSLSWDDIDRLGAFAHERGEALAHPELLEKARALAQQLHNRLLKGT